MIVIKQAVDIEVLMNSESVEGAYYLVTTKIDHESSLTWTCTCPNFGKTQSDCKHIKNARIELRL